MRTPIRGGLCALFLLAVSASAEGPTAAEVLSRFQKLRPTDDDLLMYRLDWASSFEEAQARGAKEHRPIFVVCISAHYGDLYSGHC